MQPAERGTVTCHGLDRSVTSWLLRPERKDDVLECLDFARSRGLSLCPAGGRNSFGDVFLLGDHASVDMRGLDRIVAFDPEAGTVRVEAGARIREVLTTVMPAGWQLGALSGSLSNTVGGNLASNIQGKDSWKRGSFGDQVESFRMLLADGSEREVDRQRDPELFSAAVGGLGLLGLVVEVTLRLHRAPSPLLEQRSLAVRGVPALVERLRGLDPDRHDFGYAWLDAFSGGGAGARAICESARFVPDAPPAGAESLRAGLVEPERILGLRPERFWGGVQAIWKALHAVRLHGVPFRVLNRLKYESARIRAEQRRVVPFAEYQYPMVKVLPRWNLRFRPEGFHEIHALFPEACFAEALERVLAVCRRWRRTPDLLAVRRHRGDAYPLSFNRDGLSFTLPIALAGFAEGEAWRFERGVAEIVALRGRVYLAKFPYLERDELAGMYPEAAAFVALKQRVDPERRFWSDAAERLLGRSGALGPAGYARRVSRRSPVAWVLAAALALPLGAPPAGAEGAGAALGPAPRDADGRFLNFSGPVRHAGPGVTFPFFLRRIWVSLSGDRPGAPQRVPNDGVFLRYNARHSVPTVTWIGHATLLVQMDGVTFLTDPTWADTASPVSFAGPRRFVPPGLEFDALPEIDFVVVSHNHYDHLDVETLARLAERDADTVFYVPLGNLATLRDAGVGNVVELDWGDTSDHDGVTVHCLPAKHWSRRGLGDERAALWSSWAVTGPERRFWFAGDTGWFEGFAAIGRALGPFDLAAVPIGAYEPGAMMLPSHLDPEQAVRAALEARAERLVAVHFGTFDLSDEPLDEPPRRFRAAAAAEGVREGAAWVLAIGETREF